MPVNEFEKQVQQKMEELQLKPSAEVWVEVEKRIRKEKKRRRVIFWWLFPLVLAGGLAIYYFNQPKGQSGNTLSNTQSNTQTNTKTNTSLNTPSNTIQKNELPGSEKELTESIKTQTSTHPATKDELIVKNETEMLGSTENIIIKKEAKKKIPKQKTAGSLEQYTAPGKAEELIMTKSEKNPVVADQPPTTSLNPLSNTSASPQVINPASNDKVADSASSSVATIAQPAIEEKLPAKEAMPIQVKKRNKWKWGIEFAPGLSNTKEGKLFNESKLMYAGLSGTPTTTSFAPLAAPVTIASPSKAISFQLDVFGQKQISKRIRVKAGINYSYLASRVNVGEKIMERRQLVTDMNPYLTINSYYSPAESAFTHEAYTNKYHLLGLSSALSLRILNSKSFNVHWENGITVSKLVSTNALLFNEDLRGYYKDKNAFKKTHVILSTGFTIPIFEKKTPGIMLHPSVSFGPGTILKNKSNTNPHFINYGMGLRLGF